MKTNTSPRAETKIQWTDATVNFWMGCQKVSEGCKFCYMHRMVDKDGKDPNRVYRTRDATFYKALDWVEQKRIFTCSMSDFFLEEADKWRSDAWEVIRKTPHHTWQILTKRPERIEQCLPPDWGNGWNNVWLGVSIENQKRFDRAVTLSKIPAKTRFISAEPLLDELNLMPPEYGESILRLFHWCIIGGESGNSFGNYRYRTCDVKWIEKLLVELESAQVAVFIKQMGTGLATRMGLKDQHGGQMEEWPVHLLVRNYPVNNNRRLLPLPDEKDDGWSLKAS